MVLPVAAQDGYQVQGSNASSYEYFFALALERFNLGYMFQVDYFGGRRLRGGLVLDFLVFTVPFPTPVYINGEYWHGAERRDIDLIQQLMLRSMGGFNPGKEYWGQDVGTPELALMTVRRDLA
jgi:hypothetical protein